MAVVKLQALTMSSSSAVSEVLEDRMPTEVKFQTLAFVETIKHLRVSGVVKDKVSTVKVLNFRS